jgi:hypothetical protein
MWRYLQLKNLWKYLPTKQNYGFSAPCMARKNTCSTMANNFWHRILDHCMADAPAPSHALISEWKYAVTSNLAYVHDHLFTP